MSLQDAITQIQGLAPKAAGHLVRPQDWNALIAALGEFGSAITTNTQDVATLKTQVQQLLTQMGQVVGQVQALDSRVDELEESIQPLLDNYLVTLSCARLTYASGEICELTAHVTDLSGQALSAPFPWVDFVAAWGRLRAVAGFNSRAGSGDNSVSVQVNAQGLAKVQLRAEHSEGFSETEEAQVSAVMQMQVLGQNKSVAQVFMSAPTPSDASSKSAYKVLHAEYERQDSIALRSYADTYYVRTPEWSLAPLGPNYWTQWHDYRATVIALAKPDADPTTPDNARGTASIQVTFRDWLWPWTLDYLDDLQILQDQVFQQYNPLFQFEDVYDKFRQKVGGDLVKYGIIGRKKYLSAAQKAIDLINPGSDPIKQNARQQIKQAVLAQETNEIYTGGKAAGGAPVMEIYLGQGKATDNVRQQVKQVDQKVEETAGVQAAVNVLEGRMQSAEKVGQHINSSLTLINDNVRAINPLDENSLRANVLKISADIAALKSKIGSPG
jgi:hypothetical protein